MKREICKNCGKSKEEHYELNNNLYCAFQTVYTEKASKFEPINTPQVTNNKEVSVVSASLSENTQPEQVKPFTAVLGEKKSENGVGGDETSASINRNPETVPVDTFKLEKIREHIKSGHRSSQTKPASSNFCLKNKLIEADNEEKNNGFYFEKDIKKVLNIEMGLICKLNSNEITIEEFLEERNKLFGENLK